MFVQSKKPSMGQLVGIFSGTAQYLIQFDETKRKENHNSA